MDALELELKRMRVVVNKLRRDQKHSLADVVERSIELTFDVFTHKEGSYYGITVSNQYGKIDNVYVSEKLWVVG